MDVARPRISHHRQGPSARDHEGIGETCIADEKIVEIGESGIVCHDERIVRGARVISDGREPTDIGRSPVGNHETVARAIVADAEINPVGQERASIA